MCKYFLYCAPVVPLPLGGNYTSAIRKAIEEPGSRDNIYIWCYPTPKQRAILKSSKLVFASPFGAGKTLFQNVKSIVISDKGGKVIFLLFIRASRVPSKTKPLLAYELEQKFKKLGGELRMGSGVTSINAKNGTVESVTLENGEQLVAESVISSMGYVETLNHCSPGLEKTESCATGQVSFMESLCVVDCEPRDLGYDKSIVFFSTQPQFDYKVPNEMVNPTTGVLCCSNNFNYPEPMKEGLIRLTNLANFSKWDSLSRKDYIAAKKYWRTQALESVFTFFPDFRDNMVFLDSFTPKTIKKYTGHLNGAVYGSPQKIKDGKTPVNNLFICGTDQGFLGIIGATLSGISMANLHVLQK